MRVCIMQNLGILNETYAIDALPKVFLNVFKSIFHLEMKFHFIFK